MVDEWKQAVSEALYEHRKEIDRLEDRIRRLEHDKKDLDYFCLGCEALYKLTKKQNQSIGNFCPYCELRYAKEHNSNSSAT